MRQTSTRILKLC